MGLRPSYENVVTGQGFRYHHVQTGATFQRHTLELLRDDVSKFCKANGFVLNNDEFDENVCRNTPNLVCTETPRGVGDVVHQVLNPVAKFLDNLAGTNLQGCGGCYSRQNVLNKL